jgi:hypothetical protein
MTVIDVTCPQCGEVYHTELGQVGKRIKCRRCDSLFPILLKAVQQPLETNQMRMPQSRANNVSPRANGTALRSVSVVGVVMIGLVFVFWRYSNSHENTLAVPERSGSSDGLRAEGGEQPGTESDRCDEQDRTNFHSLSNGSRMMPDESPKGHGVLEVQNGTGEDAVLLLHDPTTDETVRGVYVQAMHSVRMEGIPMGTYELAFAEGLDWDSGRATFRCGDVDYAQFDRDFEFTEKKDPEGIRYKAISVTLQPVAGGTVRTKKMSRQEFLKSFHPAVLPR